MKLKHICPHCKAELNENLMRVFASIQCPQCGKRVGRDFANVLYFPETPGNKVFAVDVYVTVCKCVKLEAADADAAQVEARKYLDGLRDGCTDREVVEKLASEGFHDAKDSEFHVAGEVDETGDIEYY